MRLWSSQPSTACHYQSPRPSRLRNPCRRGRDIKSQAWWVTLQENSLPDTIGLMTSNTVTELTRITQAQIRQNPSTEERNWIKSPPLSKKLSSVKEKTRFLKWRVRWVYQPHSRAGPMARSSLTAQNWLHGFLHPCYRINSSVCLRGVGLFNIKLGGKVGALEVGKEYDQNTCIFNVRC